MLSASSARASSGKLRRGCCGLGRMRVVDMYWTRVDRKSLFCWSFMCTAPFFLIFLQYSEKAAQSAAESVGKFESCRGFFVLIYVLAQAAPRGAGAETILHFGTVLPKPYLPTGKGSQETLVSCASLVTFCASRKSPAGGRTSRFTPHPALKRGVGNTAPYGRWKESAV